jgi:Cu-Zn family superoxide dismutase
MRIGIWCASLAVAALVGCKSSAWHDDGVTRHAVANIEARSGSTVNGSVEFQQATNGKTYVRIALKGLPPNTKHGLHLHDTGDCSAPDAASAGPHFNPTASMHGAPNVGAHHAGDLGNVTSDANGEVMEHFATPWLTLDEGATAVVGHAVVVHADPDDLTSQPAGNSGKRVGCGVVSMAASVQ